MCVGRGGRGTGMGTENKAEIAWWVNKLFSRHSLRKAESLREVPPVPQRHNQYSWAALSSSLIEGENTSLKNTRLPKARARSSEHLKIPTSFLADPKSQADQQS